MTLISGMRGTKLCASVALDLKQGFGIPSSFLLKGILSLWFAVFRNTAKHRIIASCTELVGKVCGIGSV